MQKATNFLYRAKKIFNKQTKFLLLIEISVIILVVTVALNYIFDYVTTVSADNSVVSSWEYVYTNGSSDKYEGKWNVANSLNPMSTEKTGDYLHLRTTFEASDRERALVIYTDYSPIKISVNGEAVYNNHYDDLAFVGNTYNSITLPATGSETEVEISVALPFSANIRAEVSPDSPGSPIHYSFWLIGSGIIILLGTLALLASVVLSFTKKRNGLYFIVSASAVAYGAFSAVFALSGSSYLLNFSRLYNIAIMLVNIYILVSLIAVAVIFKIKSKRFVVAICGYLLASLLVLIPQNPTMLCILSAVADIAGIAATALLAAACGKLSVKRIQYTKTAFLLLCYRVMLTAACGFMFHSRLLNIWISCERLGGLILICFIISVALSKIFSTHRNDEEELEIKNYSECVVKLAGLIKNLLSAKREADFCRIAAGDICNLAECCSSTLSVHTKASDIAFSVAVKSDKGYKPIDSRGDGEEVRFDIIENRFQSNGACYNFAETYFDFIFLKNDEPHIIFCFQNIKNGLSLPFVQMMETVFNCMEICFEQLPENENKDSEQKKENGFLSLAKSAEFNGGGNADHLQCVADYTKIIMKAMDYPEHICKIVSGAAMLHDIGKIAIPPEITNKTGLLSESERSIMKRHTEFGHIILSAFDGELMQAAAAIAKDHHEQYDGKGYGGLRGNEISEYARVVSAADVFDALTTQRAYKEAWSLEAAMGYIHSNSGKIFDPRVVSALDSCVDEIIERYREKD